MNKLKLVLCAGATTVGLIWAGAAAAQTAPASAAPAAPAAPMPSPMANPPVVAPMAANPNPLTVDAGPLGKITVDGVLSGDAVFETTSQYNYYGRDHEPSALGDITNAQVIINKSDGLVQFYVQGGAYSIPSLGGYTYKSSTLDSHLWGFVPEGFIKIVPNSTFSIEAGALPTLIGNEYNFTFQNMNIERGLLWGQEPAVSKGVQVNFSKGPVAISAAWTDGYYSNTYSAVSGVITYTFKNMDTLAFSGEGNVATNHANTFAAPAPQNQGSIFNLIYTHSQGPWTISPYFQYSTTPNDPYWGNYASSTWAIAVLTKYNITPTFSLAGRFEYEDSSGKGNPLGFGSGSGAYSITFTPTYQKGVFWVRGEISYVGLTSATLGDGFGIYGNVGSQTRFLIETGLDF